MAVQTVRFTTESGLEIKLKAVREVTLELAAAAAEEEMRKAGTLLDQPTFERKTLGGEIMHFPIRPPQPERRDPATGMIVQDGDPGNIFVQGDPDETALRQAKWDRYQQNRMQLWTEQIKRRYEALLYFGFDMGAIPPDEEWLAEEIEFGIAAPKNARERVVRYIAKMLTERDVARGIAILKAMMSGRGASEEQIAEFERLFRSSVGGHDAGRFEDALKDLRRLVGTPQAGGDAGGGGAGTDAESVG